MNPVAVVIDAGDTTGAAVARGVFDASTFFAGGEMWFGQDRLDWVEAAAA